MSHLAPKTISTIEDRNKLLSEPEALLCLWNEWSIPAKKSLAAVTSWHMAWNESFNDPQRPLYLLEGDTVPELGSWIRQVLQDKQTGAGSLYVFRSENIVDSVLNIYAAGPDKVKTLCGKHFKAD